MLPQELVALMASPVLFVDVSAKVSCLNAPMALGLNQDHTKVPGDAFLQYVTSADRDAVQAFMANALGGELATDGHAPMALHMGAPEKPAIMTPMCNADGVCEGFLVQAQDVIWGGGNAYAEFRLMENALEMGRVGAWYNKYPCNNRYQSRSWWALRGYGPDEEKEYVHEQWMARIHEDDRAVIEHSWEVLREEDNNVIEYVYRELDRSGNWMWILSRGQVLGRDASGKPLHIAGADLDITRQVIAEHQRNENAEQLRHSERLRTVGQLTGGVAHDFNNLLTVISGNAELIGLDIDPSDDRLEAILNAVQRGADLTQNLLVLSRKQSLRPSPIDVAELLRRLERTLRRTLFVDFALEVTCEDGIWNCLADKGRAENALLNLAVNAQQASKPGDKFRITAENVVVDKATAGVSDDLKCGEYVLFTVSDQGTGMSEETLDRAFEAFFTTKSEGQGTGLGLSMVLNFAKQSGGQVEIESELEIGTTVRLYLPRTKEQVNAAISKPKPALGGSTGANIMLVEDDPQIRTMISKFLRDMGHNVLSFGTADEAYESFLLDAFPDLLITDINLPGVLDGVALGHRLKSLKPELKQLYLSGYASGQNLGLKEHEIGTNFLKKPVSLHALAERVGVLLA